jgi:hypothetical protein
MVRECHFLHRNWNSSPNRYSVVVSGSHLHVFFPSRKLRPDKRLEAGTRRVRKPCGRHFQHTLCQDSFRLILNTSRSSSRFSSNDESFQKPTIPVRLDILACRWPMAGICHIL